MILRARADTLQAKSEKSVPGHARGQHFARIYCLLLNSVGTRAHARRNLAGAGTLWAKSEKSLPGHARHPWYFGWVDETKWNKIVNKIMASILVPSSRLGRR